MRRIRTEWRQDAVAEINRHPFNPRARYADLSNRKEIIYFAGMAYRSRLNFLYRKAMRQKRISKQILAAIAETARKLGSLGLYELEKDETRA